MKTQILIVDDDRDIAQELKAYLEPHDFTVVLAANGLEMQKKLKQYNIHLIVLDIMMPGEDGITLCKNLRQETSTPIIMLSAAGSETDRVLSLEMGADDFLAKPFSARELLARIKALLRRSTGNLVIQRENNSKSQNVNFSNWQLDRTRRVIMNKSTKITVPLSQREYEILSAFIENPNRILTRDQLLEYTRGIEAGPFDRSIDVNIGRLRKKIEEDSKDPQIIITVRGGGYQFNAEIS